MSTSLDLFFQSLAERKKNENDLSDVTYALCQSDEVFKQFFLDFFFGDGKIDIHKEKVEIVREQSYDEGRPDFTVNVGNDTYLIEVKIWDSNHHFDQYRSILEKKNEATGHLGYIANYTIKDDDLSELDKNALKVVCDNGRTVKTWKQLVSRLEKYQSFNDAVIKSYLSFVRNVCPFDDFELPANTVIHLSDFELIRNFLKGLEEKIADMENVCLYDTTKKFWSMHNMGHFFELKNYDGNNSVWGWVGATYTNDGAAISVEFENSDGWGELVCKRFPNLCQGNLRLYLKDKNMSSQVFLENIISYVRAKNCNNVPEYACMSIDEAAKEMPLLAMKYLPWLLDNYFQTMLNKKLPESWKIIPSSGNNDSELQGHHCGRYFTLQHNDKNKQEFWVGVNYEQHPQFHLEFPNDDNDLNYNFAEWKVLNEWYRYLEIPIDDGKPFDEIIDSVSKYIRLLLHNEVSK